MYGKPSGYDPIARRKEEKEEWPDMEVDMAGYTLEELLEIERKSECPECGSDLDTGCGFGRRDLDCCNIADDGKDDSDDCGWSASYPIEAYRDMLDEGSKTL